MDEDNDLLGQEDVAPEVEEQEPPQSAAPQFDEEAFRQRVAPLEEQVHQLRTVLDPKRIEAFQREQEFRQYRANLRAQLERAVEDGDALGAVKALMPQLEWHDRAHQLHIQHLEAQNQRWVEAEEKRRIAEEVEAEELDFYASDPESGALLREFLPTAAKAYAAQNGRAKVSKEDTVAARQWMEHLFTGRDFTTAATEMAGWVRNYKAQQAAAQQPRRLPTSPAPGARTPARRQPSAMSEFDYNDFLS